MMSWGTRCSVPYCNGRGGHRFPKNAYTKQLWVQAVKRANWSPTSGSLICKKHFEPTDYITESFYHGTVPAHVTLKRGTVPTLFMPTNMVVMPEKRQPVKKVNKPSEEKIMHVKGFDADGNPLPCFDSLRDKLGIGKEQPVPAGPNPGPVSNQPGNLTMATLNRNANLLSTQRFESETIVAHNPDEDFSFLNNHDPTMAAVQQIKEEIMSELDQDVDEDSAEIFEIVQENNNNNNQNRVNIDRYQNVDPNLPNVNSYQNVNQNRPNDDQYQNVNQNQENISQYQDVDQNRENDDQYRNIEPNLENIDQVQETINNEENHNMNEEELSGESSEENTDQTISKPPNLGIEKFVSDNQAISYYTGLDTYNRFCYALRTLGNEVYQLNFLGPEDEISVKNQFFLTLMKIKQNKDKFELSRFFEISEDCVSDIITTWINFVSKKWKEHKMFPSKEITNYFRGISGFKETFASVRSRGGSKPKKIKNSEKMKINPSVKVLTPDCLLSFISEAYGVKPNEPTIPIPRNSGSLISDSTCSVDANNTGVTHDNQNTTTKTTMERFKPTKATEQREKAITLEKTFKILGDSSLTDMKLKEDVVFICFMLMNIRNGRLTGKF